MMRAAVFRGGRDIRIEEMAIPLPGPGEVLVRVGAAGVCGSDVLAFRGQGPWQHSPDKPGRDGHELAGEIAALGDGVTGLHVGQRVAVEPKHLIACGQCPPCRNGRSHLCRRRGYVGDVHVTSEGFAEYDLAPAERVHVLPDSVSLAAGAILDCYACGVHTHNLVRTPAGSRAVVLGSGTMGLTMGQVLRAHGVKVLLTGTAKAFLDLALEAGAADEVAFAHDARAGIEDFTEGKGADLVVDAVAIPDVTLQQAVESAAEGSPVCVLGVYPTPPRLEPHVAYVREVSVHWSNSYGPGAYAEALRLVAGNQVAADALITHRFPLDRIVEAFTAADEKERSLAMKVLIEP
ncbi:alcohol dehydrogenase catalytic domain-containing protein [Herbidospora sp. NEAU-GS84]|uniref:Alcohol dehydrogenase catalytic domain-containing protein n=1 Tax=Herbidospora solisilvae TaxID=2696284 RepID=A0A7C9JEL0_9ACTN|nr:alcohol dehydrogenase catalytic domain-containing protein [Herbidospora solisilvae]NAS25284.1 alcohol dehydrogenase catalytic domain-containing protein [Herbidospora solisilvae]